MTGQAEYQRVFNDCQFRLGNRLITLLATPNALDRPRLGLAISRKVARTAVARNRIKRVIRESFRHHQDRLCALDIVVLGRSGVAETGSRELGKAMESLWTGLIEKCAGQSSN